MIPILAALALAGATLHSPQIKPKQHTFVAEGTQFVLDGKPFVIHSGELHYPRVPRSLWRDRLKKARAMGLNTICTYVFWNLHEPQQGRFDFKGNLDLAAFIREAGEEGLYVIVRPGPYNCTELDFGGLPAWLLKDRSLVARSRDPKFLAATEAYFRQVGRVIQPYLPKKGGPILMAQVENEYGSYGNDHVYMAWMRDAMRRCGFDLQLFTSDGPSQGSLQGGTLPDLPPTVNFGGGAEGAFEELAKFRPGTPRMIGEYWAGWFDHWGKAHHRTGIANHVKDLEWCLKNGVSFNLYMFHGGTNFAFLQGANGGAGDYNVDVTSYDYDAPLDESGRPTPKYAAFRELLATYAKGSLPPVPSTAPPIVIAPVRMEESASLFDALPKPVVSERPLTFEDLDQAYGHVLYRTTTPIAGKRTLSVEKLGDYATVFVNDRRVGTLDRRRGQTTIEVELPVPPSGGSNRIGILVEALSRVNFGSLLPTERKGIDGSVRLGPGDGSMGEALLNWEHFRLPMNAPAGLKWAKRDGAGPRFYRGSLTVARPGDTFLDLKGWNKGFVWVNGHNLGRFWKIGPQRTLFLPGVWLKAGRNEIVVFDDGDVVQNQFVSGLAAPILDELPPDPTRVARNGGKAVRLAGITPVLTTTLKDGAEVQKVSFATPVTARYLAIEATSEHGNGPYTTLAELNADRPDGQPIDRKKWRIIFADSEELDGENGSADNVIDNQPTTFWHSQWSASQPAHPHVLVVDLGEEMTLGALRLLPRGSGVNGRIKDLRVYASVKAFPEL